MDDDPYGEEPMRKRFLLAVCIVAGFGLCAVQAQATILTYDLLSFTGDPMEMDLTISDESLFPGHIEFHLIVDTGSTGNTGDLRGFFFNLDPFLGALDNSHIVGGDITDRIISNDSVTSTGGGNTISPAGNFDVGIEFGTPGIGTDDIDEATFYMNNLEGTLELSNLTNETDDMGLLFAARFTSVGPEGSDRSGSSKISLLGVGPENEPPVNPIPEPATLMLFGSGMIGIGVVMRRQRPAARPGR